MNHTSGDQPQKRICMGILAHVDAGKTTLSESMLYLSGAIRKLGRVDHKDAFLDTDEIERKRGITVFSKQAVFPLDDVEITLLDTPGHVDFSAEMERTLQVLDYAVLVINGADGVQGHTQTLWKLLKQYHVPVFLFINKMDQEGTDREELIGHLRERLGETCIDFDPSRERKDFQEELAVCDETVLNGYLENGYMEDREIADMIAKRNVFPCYFGSALKLEGVRELLKGLKQYSLCPDYPEEFGARVYKITRDGQGNRLTHLKVTGGTLKVKDTIGEKVNQIRIYSGDKYEAVPEAKAGTVCAVTGMEHTCPGQGLGTEAEGDMPRLEPVLTYRVMFPEDYDANQMLANLQILEEEEPQLHVSWDERLGEIQVKLMGEVQTEILKHQIKERFGIDVEFGTGNIVYKETILEPAEGVGHFEPLRHYAEVHVLLEPAEAGSGLTFASELSEDELDRNWQRLILTHLEEKEHPGILTGSAVTDMKMTLIAGKAHQKHTEGGDFREAAYRAVRQGLRKAESVLLEPYYEFSLEIPSAMVGRAMSDIQKMKGTFEPPETVGEVSILKGSAPVSEMMDYQKEVVSYTKGEGKLSCIVKGYEPCHNAEEVIEKTGYDPERDLENPTGSIFCAHGAGFSVPWDEVEEYMHLPYAWNQKKESEEQETPAFSGRKKEGAELYGQEEKELEEIFERTYGPVKRKQTNENRTYKASADYEVPVTYRKKQDDIKEYLLVDGYNIIFAWEELKELAKVNMMSARDKLMDILSDYQGYRKMTLILVFDAYKVEGNPGSVLKFHNIHVVYTKEAETADQYIEKTVHRIGRKYHVTVATSDALEQVIILGQGGHRLSADGLYEEVLKAKKELREEHLRKKNEKGSYLFDGLSEEQAEYLEQIRLGKE